MGSPSSDSDVKAYLNRLGIDTSSAENAIDIFYRIHLAHSLTIPFENLDILLNHPPSLKYEDLFEKIVVKKRGGYCYELNGLLYYMLKKMDYKVTLLSARILFGAQLTYARGHKLLLVTIGEQQFIADVGYRYGLVEPLPFISNKEKQQLSESFRLLSAANNLFVLQKIVRQEWKDLYSFTTDEQLPVDFEPHNFYNSQCADSVFTQIAIASLKTKKGSISLLDKTLVEINNGEKKETGVVSADDYQEKLQSIFGLQLQEEEINKLYIPEK